MVMKSGPKKTDLTPSILNSNFASGEQKAADPVGKSMVLPSNTFQNIKFWYMNKFS